MEPGPERGQIRHRGTVIPYTVIRSDRRHRTVQISVNGGDVVVRAPVRYPASAIAAGVAQRADWILKQAATPPPPPAPPLAAGMTLPFRGQDLVLERASAIGPHIRVEASGPVLRVTLPRGPLDSEETLRFALGRWYAGQATAIVHDDARRWSAVLGLSPRAIYIRDQRSRWGSCSADGSLRINWRVAMLEPALAEYVVVHELCHLRERNHSAAFWALVQSALPDVDRRQARLRGVSLPL